MFCEMPFISMKTKTFTFKREDEKVISEYIKFNIEINLLIINFMLLLGVN